MLPQSTPIRVLIVDDDATIRELLAALLEAEGYAVESAESGEAALALLHRSDSAPNLLLADVQMPGITGAQLARQLRRACGTSTLLLAMSGSQPPAKTISLFDGFLLKPYKIEQVAAALYAQSNLPTNNKKRAVASLSRTSNHTSKSVSISASAQKNASESPMSIRLQEVQFPESIDATESGGNAPVLNETIYRQLAGSIPTPQLKEMYTLCVDDARKRIAGMRVLAAAKNSVQFVREAHSIKGGCGMLGATELHRMATELEANGLQTGRAGKARDVNSLDKLSAACDRLERMLRSRV
jgi:CheY-like chemotaxis protein